MAKPSVERKLSRAKSTLGNEFKYHYLSLYETHRDLNVTILVKVNRYYYMWQRYDD